MIHRFSSRGRSRLVSFVSLLLLAGCTPPVKSCGEEPAGNGRWQGVAAPVAAVLSGLEKEGAWDPLTPLQQVNERKKELLDRAMDQAVMLNDDRERKTAMMHIMASAWAEGVPYNVKGSDPLSRARELAVELGDREMEALCSLYMSGDNAADADRALIVFREKGDRFLMTEGLTYAIMDRIVSGRYREIGPLVEELRDRGEKDPGREVVNRALEGFILDTAPLPGGRIVAYSCTAEIFTVREGERVVYSGQPGIGGNAGGEKDAAGHDFSLFWELANNGDFLCRDMAGGESRVVKTFSFGKEPLLTEVTCVSAGETVTVPAGTFRDCRHMRFVTGETAGSGAGPHDTGEMAVLNRILKGTRDVWYAPGVGIVKFSRIRGDEGSSLVLRESGGGGDGMKEFFPLSEGRTWVYGVESAKGKNYTACYTVRVEFRQNDRWYLSHRGYVMEPRRTGI